MHGIRPITIAKAGMVVAAVGAIGGLASALGQHHDPGTVLAPGPLTDVERYLPKVSMPPPIGSPEFQHPPKGRGVDPGFSVDAPKGRGIDPGFTIDAPQGPGIDPGIAVGPSTGFDIDRGFIAR